MEEEEQQGVVFLGRDLTKIPCFRNSFLYATSSYFGVGLLTFLLTSRPALSSHVGMASFVTVNLGYFTNCRLELAKKKKEIISILKEQEEDITTITTKSYIKGNEPIENILSEA